MEEAAPIFIAIYLFIMIPFLVLYIIMIVKYFQMTSDIRKSKDMLREIRDKMMKDDEKPKSTRPWEEA